MKINLIKHFEYELWANKMIVASFKKIAENDDRALLLFSHILSAHSMWLSRIKDKPFTTRLFQERTLNDCEILMNENAIAWQDYLPTITSSELERVIHFTMPTDGTKRKMRIDDALTHLISHSAYHRGQIVARMKGKLDVLPHTTYIAYASEMDV